VRGECGDEGGIEGVETREREAECVELVSGEVRGGLEKVSLLHLLRVGELEGVISVVFRMHSNRT